MSAFWKHYEAAKPHVAGAVDDVRHKLVEEGWFKQTATEDISPASDRQKAGPAEPVMHHHHHTLYAEIWGREPKAGDLYGTPGEASPTATNDLRSSPRQAAHDDTPDF